MYIYAAKNSFSYNTRSIPLFSSIVPKMSSSRITLLFLALALVQFAGCSSDTSSSSSYKSRETSLNSLLKAKDINLFEGSLTESEWEKYAPLAIEELESELVRSIQSHSEEEHHRTRRTLLKKKLIIAKLLILKALLASRGKKSQGGYGYAPSVPSHYGPPKMEYGPPPPQKPAYGPPPSQYGPPGYNH